MECYICLYNDSSEPILRNCECKGTTAGIHKTCQREWARSQVGWNKYLCPICNTVFKNQDDTSKSFQQLPVEVFINQNGGITIEVLILFQSAKWKGSYHEIWKSVLEDTRSDVLDYLIKQKFPNRPNDISRLCAKNGHLSSIQLLHQGMASFN